MRCSFLDDVIQSGDVMEHIRKIFTNFGSPVIKFETVYMKTRLALGATVNCPFVFKCCVIELEKKARSDSVTIVLEQRMILKRDSELLGL